MLGVGASGKVVAGQWEGQRVAVKFMDQNAREFYFENFKAECTILTLIRHPNIIPMFGAGVFS